MSFTYNKANKRINQSYRRQNDSYCRKTAYVWQTLLGLLHLFKLYNEVGIKETWKHDLDLTDLFEDQCFGLKDHFL